MNSEAFPKPCPAAPIPLEIWLGDTDRAEVGREAFFRGRDQEYGVFKNAVTRLKNGRVGGGTMIFQGAPGAGKTALKLECMEAVRQHSTPDDPWVAVSVEAKTLETVSDVLRRMILETNRERERLAQGFPGLVSKSMEKLKEVSQKLYEKLSNQRVSMHCWHKSHFETL
ncbi:MAG: hypothetical protein OXD01_14230 [Gammaproteobacteria bacterium]|nr:hypothetical protein [Gammaproteobacteria bacterium]